ncbi:hypothetical protein AB0J86_26635 [Micromonospora sp. NPDC049559]|uniref:hypothetical protein n=1 Tax=Micromonospora sp. NPDC049559 TaxID=3155923 RepID=UPI003441A54A
MLKSRRKTLKGWPVRVAAALAVTAIAVAGTSTPASAYAGDTWVYLRNSSGTKVASMQHVDDGDYFRTYDNLADGHGARGYLYSWTGYDYTLIMTSYNGKGAGTYTQMQYDVWSTNFYAMRVCSVDGSEDTSPGPCSDYKYFSE